MKTRKEKIREIENKGEGCDICEEAHRDDAIYFIDADNVVFCNFCADNMREEREKGCKMKYGEKRDYRKIDIFLNGEYQCSTTWARTLKEAKKRFIEEEDLGQYVVNVEARFSE